MRLRKSSVVIAAVAIALSACGSNTPDEALGTLAPVPTDLPPIWSMTGLPGPSDATNKPIMVVKIENSVPARPQTGLESADTIFEEEVEEIGRAHV